MSPVRQVFINIILVFTSLYPGLKSSVLVYCVHWRNSLSRVFAARNLFYNYKTIAMAIVCLVGNYSSLAQNRDGSIDLNTGGGGAKVETFHSGGFGFENSPFTVESWIYMAENVNDDFNFFGLRSSSKTLYVSYNGDNNRNGTSAWKIEWSYIGGFNINSWNRGYTEAGFVAPTFLNQWHHVAVTASGDKMKLYIDGELAGDWTLNFSSGNTQVYPSTSSASFFIGGLTTTSNIEGRLYANEIRLWDEALSDTNIEKYYDEEINDTHPNSSNLVLYYHGNESSENAQNSALDDFPDASGNALNGTGSRSSVALDNGFTPNIKPPSLGSASSKFTITADECEENTIGLVWTEENTYNTNSVNPHYLIRRDDFTEIYSDSGQSADDNGLSPGDSHTYNLQTFWLINGVPIYADDVITSNAGSIKEQYGMVTTLEASTTNCDKTIDVTWTWSGDNPPEWTLFRQISDPVYDTEKDAVAVLEGDARSFNDLRGPEVNYYYWIIASGTDENGCEVLGALSDAQVAGFTSRPPTPPSDLAVEVDDVNNRLNISWNNPEDSYADGYILRREKLDGSDPVDYVINNASTNTYEDPNILICETYRYKIAATNECAIAGVFSDETQTGLLGLDIDDVISSVNASKGYYGNQVLLEWEINGSLSQVDLFEIERTVAGQDNYQGIGVVDNNFFFNDQSASAGTFYNYRVTGETLCNDLIANTNQVVDLGFRQPFGIANGHVEYEGGNAVDSVTITFEKQDGQAIGQSLALDGVDDYVAIDKIYYEGDDYTEMSVEAWIKTEHLTNGVIASFGREEYWRFIYLSNGQIRFFLNTNLGELPLTSNVRINTDEWHHVAAVYNSGELQIYIDGKFDNSIVGGATFGSGLVRYGMIGAESLTDSFNGTIGTSPLFEGKIDEFRIWSKALTAEEINANYNRYLGAEEVGLDVYFRCDEGISTNVYDASKSGDVFNKNDGILVNGAGFSEDIPTSAQLGIRGITDVFGDYNIPYIPYSGSGDLFRVVPSFGQHIFSPSSKSVFLGDGAAIQNGVDFTDISSFAVTGTVKYDNTNVPVEGVTLLIDGQTAVGSDNKIVRTDVDGKFSLNVPIGFHFISVEKEGHVFNEGIFPPLDELGQIERREFTEDVLGLEFSDNTLVKVAGRVVGGTVQAEHKLGFDQSINNVGVASFTLSLQNEAYGLPSQTITTDPISGEYFIELIPEQFVNSDVVTGGVPSYSIASEDLPVLDLRNSLTPLVSMDTTFTQEGSIDTVKTFTYHHALSHIIRVNPQIEVYGKNNTAFEGDKTLFFVDQETGEADTLDLNVDNPFPFPFFQMPHHYESNIYLYEIYENSTYPDEPLIDKVPVEGGDITITDNIGINPTDGNTGKTDVNGHFHYKFTAGVPNLSNNGAESYTKTFEVNADVSGIGVTWNDGAPFRAYVLGSSANGGTGFVTYGPDQVDFVLRDPPGSHSYAYLEKGSTYSIEENWGFDSGSNLGLDYVTDKGVNFIVGGGLGGPVSSIENSDISEIGVTLVRGTSTEGKYVESYQFNERIETSSDPNDVGAPADLFIGKGINLFVNKTNNLRLVDRSDAISEGWEFLDLPGSDIVIGIIPGLVMDNNGTPTYFIYSQRFILEELIPEFLVVRDNLLASDKYESHFSYGDRFYGLNNDDNSLKSLKDSLTQIDPLADTLNLSYTFTQQMENDIDSVEFLNEQITKWHTYLSINESAKAEAKLLTNLSVDGSGGAYSSEVSQNFNSSFSSSVTRTFRLTYNAGFGVLINGGGLKIRNTSNYSVGLTDGTNKEIDHSMTFGYVIDERDEGDFYSIDVKTIDNVGLYNRNQFSDYNLSFANSKADENFGVVGAASAGSFGLQTIIKYYGEKKKKSNTLIATATFGVETAYFFLETGHIADRAISTVNNQSGITEDFKISGFSVSSPIFSVRGGASMCPYEGEQRADFYSSDNDSDEGFLLHTATLQREIPTINVEPAIQSNVPEDQNAVFSLQLGNESESNSNMWYEISIDEASNPDGAVLLIDGLTAEKQYLVPANEILEKTLTIAKGASGVLSYDSLAIILHSPCQFDPTSSQDDIADTVYVTARFIAECSEVALSNFQENWILKDSDNNTTTVSLDGYNVNHPTIEKIDFQYKSLSGTPVVGMTFFKNDQVDEYATYDGPKALIDGASEVSFTWDFSSLNDREYQLRARSHCSDGSIYESDYVTGLIDRSNPVVFGTPSPEDGVLNAGDDVTVRFSETLEAGLVKDFNISVKSVLNGADVSHATSLQFDGANNEMTINNINFNNKSFTLEYWLKNEVESTPSEATILSFGEGSHQIEIAQTGTELVFKLAGQSVSIDPTSSYTQAAPWHHWHHWTFTYNSTSQVVEIFMDDVLLITASSVIYTPSFQGQLNLGTKTFMGKMHDFRIWEDVRSLGEITEYMNISLIGNEAGLYGYWPMDEGSGDLAIDLTASRNAVVEAEWSLEPGGFSWEFSGDDYISMNSLNVNYDEETDFTIDFWFKGAGNGSTQTLLSNGLGNGNDPIADTLSTFAIEARADGSIHFLNGGFDFKGTDEDVMDDEWHHLALTVDRRNNAKMFIDGKVQLQTSSANMASIYGPKIALGARQNLVAVGTYEYDNYFTGAIDELRFWNTSRSTTLVQEYMNTKVDRDEIGVVSYLPFESYEVTLGVYLMQSSLADQVLNDNLVVVDDATSSDGIEHFSSQKPPVRDVRGLQKITFDFAVNGDEIIISPIGDANRIEGQVMEFTVMGVVDLNGNSLKSPVTWTAFVQQNQVKWNDDNLDLEKPIDESLSFTHAFTNEGGVSVAYELENIPAWLSIDEPVSGFINPQEEEEITFTVNDALNIGYYSHSINITTEENFSEKLNINLRVFGDEPNWEVDPRDFDFSMNLIGHVTIEDERSTDINDIVSVFVGEELRGNGNMVYVPALDDYLLFLSIYSNNASGDDLDLRIYDASTGKTHEEVLPDITFISNGVLGTINTPINITANQAISSEMSFEEGWNWFSVNLNDANLSSVNTLFAGIGNDGDIIKDLTGFDQYDAGSGWFGTITSNGGLMPTNMYKVKLTTAGVVKLIGVPFEVGDNSQQISEGWNYVGYLPQVQMTLEEALVSASPTDGDLVKTENQFAIYSSSIGWIGSLQSMKSGQGYMLLANQSGALTFPERASLTNGRLSSDVDETPLFTVQPNSGGHTMSVVASVIYPDNFDLPDDQVLVAYHKEMVKGYARPVDTGDEEAYFISIAAEENEQIDFKVLDQTTGEYLDLQGGLSYYANGITGSLKEPLKLTIPAELALQFDQQDRIDIFPNPFSQALYVRLSMEIDEEITVQIIDLGGKINVHKVLQAQKSGITRYSLKDEVFGLSGGVYLLQIEKNGKVQTFKITK